MATAFTIAAGYITSQAFERAWDVIAEDEDEDTPTIEIINRALAEELDNYAQESEVAWTERRMLQQIAFERLAKTIGLEALIKCWLESSSDRDQLLNVLDAASTVRRIED